MRKHFSTVDAVIQHYLERRKATSVLSSREAVTAIRAAMPNSPQSDRELADLFVAAAIGHGRNLAFDMSEEPPRAA